MLASLGFVGLTDIHEMNALKTCLARSLISFAAVYFIFAGLISWPKAGVMTVGALAGYFFGAHFGPAIPQNTSAGSSPHRFSPSPPYFLPAVPGLTQTAPAAVARRISLPTVPPARTLAGTAM